MPICSHAFRYFAFAIMAFFAKQNQICGFGFCYLFWYWQRKRYFFAVVALYALKLLPVFFYCYFVVCSFVADTTFFYKIDHFLPSFHFCFIACFVQPVLCLLNQSKMLCCYLAGVNDLHRFVILRKLCQQEYFAYLLLFELSFSIITFDCFFVQTGWTAVCCDYCLLCSVICSI